MHTLIQTARRGDGVEVQIVVNRLRIDDAPHSGVGCDALHAGSECELTIAFCVAEAFRADAVEHQAGLFFQWLEHCEGKIAAHQGGQFCAES